MRRATKYSSGCSVRVAFAGRPHRAGGDGDKRGVQRRDGEEQVVPVAEFPICRGPAAVAGRRRPTLTMPPSTKERRSPWRVSDLTLVTRTERNGSGSRTVIPHRAWNWTRGRPTRLPDGGSPGSQLLLTASIAPSSSACSDESAAEKLIAGGPLRAAPAGQSSRRSRSSMLPSAPVISMVVLPTSTRSRSAAVRRSSGASGVEQAEQAVKAAVGRGHRADGEATGPLGRRRLSGLTAGRARGRQSKHVPAVGTLEDGDAAVVGPFCGPATAVTGGGRVLVRHRRRLRARWHNRSGRRAAAEVSSGRA